MTTITFTSQSDFSTRVQQIVSETSFMNNWLRQLQFDNKLDDAINNKVPKKVKSEIKKLTNEIKLLVENQLKSHSNEIPKHVSAVLTEKISFYLSNHTQMTNILTQHSSNLTAALLGTATDFLTKISNEEQYHMMTDQYIEACKNKFDIAITDSNINANRQLLSNGEVLKDQLKTHDFAVQELVENTRTAVNRELKQLTEANTKIVELEKRIEKLQSTLDYLGTIVAVTTSVTILGFCFVAVKFNNCIRIY